MEPPSPFDFPARRPSPLHPLSPERVNRRPASIANDSHRISDARSRDGSPALSSPTRKANLFADYNPITRTPSPSKEVFGGGVAQSPSLPDLAPLRTHGRNNSDVQVLVKRFEHLDVRDRDAESEARRRKQEMELRRAQLGREEAESELKKWREECRRIAEDLKESRHRESKVSNRLEKVMVCCSFERVLSGIELTLDRTISAKRKESIAATPKHTSRKCAKRAKKLSSRHRSCLSCKRR